MLHELVVVLAGFPSSLPVDELHPGEREIFLKAVDFGVLHADLKRACRNGGVEAAAVELQVLGPFANHLVGVEKKILEGGSRYGDPENASLAAIYADTVFQWHQVFEYAHGILALAAKVPTIDLISQLSVDTQSGFPAISKLATNLLVACDRDWLRTVTRWVLWGTGKVSGDYFAHPNLDPATTRTLYECGRNLEHVDTTKLMARHKDVRVMLLKLQAVLDEAELPIANIDMQRRVEQVKEGIFSIIAQHAVDSQQIHDLLKVIRKTVLAGSGLFCQAFYSSASQLLNSDGNLEPILQTALASYAEDSDELSPPANAIAARVFHLERLPNEEQKQEPSGFDDLIFGVRSCFRIDLQWPDTLYFNGQHCNVYGEMANYLLSFAVVNNSLQTSTPTSFTYKLLLNALWQYLQDCIDQAFKVIEPVMSEPPARGLHKQTQALQRLGDQILLRDAHDRVAMRNILLAAVKSASSSSKADMEPIKTLVNLVASKDNMEPLLAVLQPFF